MDRVRLYEAKDGAPLHQAGLVSQQLQQRFPHLPMEEEGRYTFHLLLTQVETRRDWLQGEATLEIEGRTHSFERTEGKVQIAQCRNKFGRWLQS